MYSYAYFFCIIARPQIALSLDNIQYVILALCFVYLISSQMKSPFSRAINIFGQLINLGLLNFFFEISRGSLDYLVQLLLIFINIFEQIFAQGTLNFDSSSIFNPTKSLLSYIAVIGNITLMYLSRYQFDLFVIQLVAILNAFITLMQLLLQFPKGNSILTTLTLNIQIMTIYLGLVQLMIGLHNYVSDLIIFLFMQKIIYMNLERLGKQVPKTLEDLIANFYDLKILKQIKVKSPTQKEDIVLYASLLAHQEKYYEGLMVLHSIKKLSWLSQIKKELMIKEWLSQLDTKLKNQNKAQKGLSEAVEHLMELEDYNVTLQTQMVNLLKNKCRLQQIISQQEKISLQSLLKFIEQITIVQKELERQYSVFPNQKTQNVLCFLYSEILNEFTKANLLQQQLTKIDDKQNFSVFTNKMVYLISTYNSEILIKRASNNAPILFKMNHNKLLQQNINLIIPPGIKEQHQRLVKKFLINGESKYMRRLDVNYYYNNAKGTLHQIDFAIDVSFTSEEINFITFLQPIYEQPLVMVLNADKVVTATTESILTALNLNTMTYFKNHVITKFMPTFKKHELSGFYENIDFIVNVDKEEVTSNSINTYLTSLDVVPKVLNGEILFYTIKFEFFKKQENSVKFTYTETNNSMVQGAFSVSENVFIDDPNGSINEQQNFITSNQNAYQKIQNNELMIIDSTLHQTQFKDAIQSSRPLFYQTQNKINYSVSVSDEDQNKEEPQQDFSVAESKQIESSKVSSLKGLRQSGYFKKYEIMSKLEEIKGLTKNHKVFLSFLSVCLLIQLSFVIAQFSSTNTSLTNLIFDIDLLQIKNFAFQPFESFLVTRWTIFNYNNLKAAGAITEEAFKQLIAFPRSNLPLGFDRLEENVNSVLNKLQLQQFLESTYLDIQLYTSSNQGEHYNVSLRNCITIMLNYQYITKMAYQLDGNVVVDSPHIYYQYRNYYILKTEFGRINQDILEDTINRSIIILSKLQIIYILSLTFLLIFLMCSYFFYSRIELSHTNFINLLFCCRSEYFNKDIQRLISVQSIINSDYNNLFSYQFDMHRKEQYFDEIKTKLDKKDHKKFILENNSFLSVTNYSNRIFFCIIFIVVLTQASVSYGQVKNYLDKYPATAKFYKGVSDIGTDVPCVFAQSNILYGRAFFSYYNETDIQLIFKEINQALAELQDFTINKIDFEQQQYIDMKLDTFYQIILQIIITILWIIICAINYWMICDKRQPTFVPQ
ncbi:unnamed protein product (macronuclear) [Paramecium tetraurelia]|uniref:Transmembrane protein n=1 Tax=Paramecium tetraurelia TaxID=5888 RepID=A0ECJ1_PARTE|nr:uncharacterized protein GSPATT00003877001 [Paramecium tetraurelia]CAK93008.1 unnamed protein product [Paramecium tetraurelia]|eukprot:XP_001460405.1 hypothetical protein (macronuclear) [Paramecium tetraurelia strain d4-2]